ncbi:MAG: diaminopimelate decarboxylase [Deltaproteobacteria bacterium]|nr:diaminopimelate decarboxylase [Deltaproteobacteria bacterium]
MDHFDYRGDDLFCEGVSLARIAEELGTPTYVYSQATLKRHYGVFDKALAAVPHLICFSVKANSNGAVLRTLARMGAGADIVSGGELMRALRAGIPASRIVFSGVGKREDEIAAALKQKILLFNVESTSELRTIARVAEELQCKAPVALRVNPDVDPGTHPYIATGLRKSKFGIPLHHAREVYEQALGFSSLEVRGIDCHIGSQLTSVGPLVESVGHVVELAQDLLARGVNLSYLDIGGGLGIRYSDETPPTPDDYGAAVVTLLKQFGQLPLTVITEPGRVIAGNAGVLLTRVLYRKSNEQKEFLVVDAAMNDLLRPSLYGSFHGIQPVRRPGERVELELVDVVGPVCESGDFLAQERPMPPVAEGALLAVMSAGAYGWSMSSNYNSRLRAAEVLVSEDRHALVRCREEVADLWRHERDAPWL